MPIIKNKITGISYPVSESELRAIKSNPRTKGYYIYPDDVVETPAAVVAALEKLEKPAENETKPVANIESPVNVGFEEVPDYMKEEPGDFGEGKPNKRKKH